MACRVRTPELIDLVRRLLPTVVLVFGIVSRERSISRFSLRLDFAGSRRSLPILRVSQLHEGILLLRPAQDESNGFSSSWSFGCGIAFDGVGPMSELRSLRRIRIAVRIDGLYLRGGRFAF